MPAEFERRVAERLSLLRSDVLHLDMADGADVRRRGIQRSRQRAATGTLAAVVGIGLAGYGLAGAMPDQEATPLQPGPLGSETPTAERSSTGSESPTRTQTQTPPPASHPYDPPGDSADPTSGDPSTTPSGTPSPNASTSPGESTSPATPTPTPPPPASNEALLTATQMPEVNDSTQTWTTTSTGDGEGASHVSNCQSDTLAELGASDAVRRNFTWGSSGASVTGVNLVAVFGSTDEAGQAYDTFGSWLDACSWGTPHGPTAIAVGGGQAGWWWVGRENADGTGQLEVVGLVQKGAALSVVVWREQSQDLIYDTDPMRAPLQASAARLTPYAD